MASTEITISHVTGSHIYSFNCTTEFSLPGEGTRKVILDRPYSEERKLDDGTIINPITAGSSKDNTYIAALYEVEGIYYAEIKGYRLQIKIDVAFSKDEERIAKQVMGILDNLFSGTEYIKNSCLAEIEAAARTRTRP